MTDDSGPDKLKCSNCGTEYARHGYIAPRDNKPYYCLECALPPEFLAELEQLADEWQGNLWMPGTPQNATFERCAQELRSLISEYGDSNE